MRFCRYKGSKVKSIERRRIAGNIPKSPILHIYLILHRGKDADIRNSHETSLLRYNVFRNKKLFIMALVFVMDHKQPWADSPAYVLLQ